MSQWYIQVRQTINGKKVCHFTVLRWHLQVKLLLVENISCFAVVITISIGPALSSAWQDALVLSMHSSDTQYEKNCQIHQIFAQ